MTKLSVATSSEPAGETRQDWLLMILLLLIICLVEIHTLQFLFAIGLNREIYGAFGILHGTPEWRVYQNRLLGPLLVELLCRVSGHTFASSYNTVVSLLIALPTVLTCLIVRGITHKSVAGLAAAAQFAVLVIVLQDQLFFYLWDAVDLTTMLIFAYAVLYRKGDLRILIPLFVVELLNRESAEFIAFWITISAVCSLILFRHELSRRKPAIIQAIFGMLLMLAGFWWTHWVRAALFQHSFVERVGSDPYNGGNGEHFTLFYNLQNFVQPVEMPSFTIALACCLALGVASWQLAARLKSAAIPIIGLLAAMAGSVWMFGLVVEIRVWLEFIPFGVLTACVSPVVPAIASTGKKPNAKAA